MSFVKEFMSLFDWFSISKSYTQMSNDLDNSMVNLYDKMGWGSYSNPLKTTYIFKPDIGIITLKEDMENTIYSSNVSNIKQSIDPARPRTSKNYTRQQYK